MQSHKVLSGSLVRRASLAGIEDMTIPAMSGVVTDFLGEMIEVDRKVTPAFEDVSRLLETEILHGEVVLAEEPSGYPEVFFRSDSGTFPLSRTSSMISELAPIVIYLRYIVRKRDLLFIEEPEAHLHPQTQIIFARILARLVNDGLLVGLTTHSEFFLQQLNNSIIAGSTTSEAADESGLPQETRLRFDRVGAYVFESSQNGTVVRQLSTSSAEGIPGTGFDVVTEQLYNQAIALEERSTHAD
jgi:predicted ATPase